MNLIQNTIILLLLTLTAPIWISWMFHVTHSNRDAKDVFFKVLWMVTLPSWILIGLAFLGDTFFIYSDKVRRQIINHEMAHIVDYEDRLSHIPAKDLKKEMVHDDKWVKVCKKLFGEVTYSVPATHYPIFKETRLLKDYTSIAVPRLGVPINTLKEKI